MDKATSPLRYPGDETEFFLNFLPAVSRQILNDGIHLFNIGQPASRGPLRCGIFRSSITE